MTDVAQEEAGKRPRRSSSAHEIGALLLLALVTLVHSDGLKDGYRTPKLWLLLIGASLLLPLAWAGLGSLGAICRASVPVGRAVGPLVVVAVLATFLSPWRTTSLEQLGILILGSLLVGAWAALPLRFPLLLSGLRILGVVVAIWLIADSIAPSDLPDYRARMTLRSTLGNPADVAIFLLIPCLSFQHRLRARWARVGFAISDLSGVVLVLAAGLTHAAVMLTQTITVLLALAVASFVLWWPLGETARQRLVVGVTILAIGGALLASPLRDRFLDKGRQLVSGEVNEFLTGRLDGWRVAVELIEERPVVGHGLGSYGYQFNRTKEQLISRGVDFYRQHGTFSSFGNAHNELLEVGVEMGILGVLALLWGVAVLVRRILTIAPPDRRLLAACAVGFGLVCLTYFPLRTPATALSFMLLVAAILTASRNASCSPATAERRRLPALAYRGGLVVLALVLLALHVPRATETLRAERRLWLAETRASELDDVRNDAQRRLWRRTKEALEEAFDERPLDSRLPMAIGSYHLLAEDAAAAERWYLRSLDIELRPETLLNLSRALRAQDRPMEARAVEQRLLRLDPQRRHSVRRQRESWPDE